MAALVVLLWPVYELPVLTLRDEGLWYGPKDGYEIVIAG